MTILRIDQVESGLDKLLEQLKDKPNIRDTITTYLSQSQSTQSTYEQMLDERSVFTAVGQQLDIIGKIVGEGRSARNDTDYRAAIFIRIIINSNNATLPYIKEVISLLSGIDKENIRVVEHHPAGLYIYLTAPTADESLIEVVERLLPVGVNLGYMGYGDNDLVFTPYDTEYVQIPVATNVDDNIITDELDPLLVTQVTQAEYYEKAWLAERVTTSLFDLVDDVGDNLVDDVGDTLEMLSEEEITGQVHGICMENL